ncbi:lyase family protein, partial [Acidobacteriota bacterium]
MRREKDSLGHMTVPEDAYYGIQAMRASKNFPISGFKLPFSMDTALAQIKKAAAETNKHYGRIPEDVSNAIIQACEEMIEGRFMDQVIVDVFQMGAGTSYHMNCNEILANRAEELLGGTKGQYKKVHPVDHVNLGQRTN